jgi:hypothetical protein
LLEAAAQQMFQHTQILHSGIYPIKYLEKQSAKIEVKRS